MLTMSYIRVHQLVFLLTTHQQTYCCFAASARGALQMGNSPEVRVEGPRAEPLRGKDGRLLRRLAEEQRRDGQLRVAGGADGGDRG